MARPKTQATCHPELPCRAKGLCASCYRRSRRKFWPSAKSSNRNRAYKARHSSRHVEFMRKQRAVVTEWLRNYKESTPCADCGRTYPSYVMDFDHVGTKLALVSTLKKHSSLARVKQEMENCQLVCSNCHRIRTHQRKEKVNASLAA